MTKKNNFHKEIKPYISSLDLINRRCLELESLSDLELKQISGELKQSACNGDSPDKLLIEAFAVVCETSRRVLGMKPFDVQMAAGIALHQGKLIEMQTGEGKTLAAVMPVYLNSLTGQGVHVLTFNDYLARRDVEWMGPIYRFLGQTVAYINDGMTIGERQAAYAADITYLTAKEAGFDFLRDQRCLDKKDLVHRRFHYALVDEADSILIDEARIPLVIAGELSPPPVNPYQIAQMIRGLNRETDYYSDEYAYDVNFTDQGLEKVETILGCGDLHEPANNQIFSATNLALQAEVLLERDVDYIVRDGKVEIVDEFTGRVADNRRWPYGLHTAIEAKEGVELQPEGMILGSITLQHFLALYPKMAGMTATAKTAENDFSTFYNLKVRVIPPHRPCIRIDHDDVVFTHKQAKDRAILQEIISIHATGRPILVGTASVEESEQLASQLLRSGIECRVLNAKNDETEASIIAEAGTLKAITISTNMAGRGTDIKLGGRNQLTHDQVAALGGLYVIGTNKYESRRIDLQLRGRAGRQGDPGSTRFFISLEDDLIQRYRVKELIPKRHIPQKQDGPVKNRIVSREIARAQRIIEGQNFEIRKTLTKYSFLVEEQRKILNYLRNQVLMEANSSQTGRGDEAELLNQLDSFSTINFSDRMEKHITLTLIDRYWAEHLEYISFIKQGIHLWNMAGKDPSVEFGNIAIKAFDELQQRLPDEIKRVIKKLEANSQGFNMEQEGLIRPSSTWTYMVNDSFFENPLRRLMMGSNAISLAAGLVALFYLPIIIIERLFGRFSKK